MGKITGNEPATGFGIPASSKYDAESYLGLTIREHFAMQAVVSQEEISKLTVDQANKLSLSRTFVETGTIEHLAFRLEAEAKLKVMKADALIAELNKEEDKA